MASKKIAPVASKPTNLFATAKAKGATVSGKAKPEKLVVEIRDVLFHNQLSRLAEVNAELDTLSAESAILGQEVKERSIKEFQKLYTANYRNPESFVIRALPNKLTLPTASLMFIPTDKYISINKERAAELQATYGDSIVTATTTYEMNGALVEKYSEVISGLIANCKAITEEDKAALIIATNKYVVTKGTINELATPTYKDHKIETLLEDIKPVYQLKSIKKDIKE